MKRKFWKYLKWKCGNEKEELLSNQRRKVEIQSDGTWCLMHIKGDFEKLLSLFLMLDNFTMSSLVIFDFVKQFLWVMLCNVWGDRV